MSDVAVLPTGGTSGGGGGPNWLLIGGAGVGVVILLMMMRGKGGGAGQPTVAAGTSINAALGSIQEENLNLMGQLGQSTGQLGTQISGVSTQLANTESNLSGQITTGNQALAGSITAGNQAAQQQGTAWYNGLLAGMLSYFNQLTGQVSGVSGQVSGVSGQVSTGLGNVATEISANNSTLTAELQRLFQNIPAPSATSLLNGVDLSNYRYVWYQPQGADQFHAAVYQVNNGVAQAISWAQYVAQTGLSAFPGVGSAPRNSQFLVM